MAQERPRSFAVIGLGTFGTTVATNLVRFGDRVLAIDINEQPVARLANEVSEVVIADGRDEEALREAGVDKYDVAVVGIGDDLEANILCTMNCKLIGVPKVWVKALHRTHHRILRKLGADRIIEAEHEIGLRVAQMLHNPLVRDYLRLGNGYYIVDFKVPEDVDGRQVESLALAKRFDIRCLGLMRGSRFIGCEDGKTELNTDDKLLLLGKRDDLSRFGDSL